MSTRPCRSSPGSVNAAAPPANVTDSAGTSNTSIANKFNSKPVEFKGWTIRMRMDNISDRNSTSSFIANKLNEKFSFVAQTRRAIEDKITVYEGSGWLGKLSYRIKNNSLKSKYPPNKLGGFIG